MNLNDPSFLKFDGSPDLGRVPPRLVVDGNGGTLTGEQWSAVEQAYLHFRSACRLSVAPFHSEQVTLSDGTEVWLWSLQGRDEVIVWPKSGGAKNKLPHGFAVATNWHGPLIYRRDLNDGVHWLLGPQTPQIVNHTTTHYDNQVFRKNVEADAFFNLPHVRDHWDTVLWDYKMNGAPTISETPVVPFLLKNSTTGVYALESPHYASGGKLIDATGATPYTMADATGILIPGADGYPEPVVYWPGATDAEGNQAALAAWRYALLSPSSNIWKFRLWNERIRRTGDATYELIERNSTDITTPWGKQTVTTTNISDNQLGEDPKNHFKYKGTQNALPGAYYGGGSGRLYFVGWAGPDQWVDISEVSTYINSASALREVKEQESGAASFTKAILAPAANDIGYIEIESSLNYPASVYWRGGEALKAYSSEALASFLGYGLPYNYRVYSAKIIRYDTKYDVDGSPAVTAKLGWKNLHLLEGTTTGRMSGKEHTNELQQSGVYYFIDSTFAYRWITTEIKNPSDFPFHPYSQYYWDWMDAANVKDVYWADYMAYGTHSGYTQTTAPNGVNKYEYPFNIRPSNTASYTLTSRYVIDYDHKGRFYAAIRCEVDCSGAEWEENLGVYKGFMQVKTHPTYTVKVWFECEWNGVFAQQLLVEESVTRPMFEAITISKFNPWYWPYIAYIDRDCKVRTPPEPTPDENFMMMFANLAGHQGVNPNLCCADVRPDIIGTDAERAYSKDGVEYSYEEDGFVTPHTKYVTGQLYARTFKLSDFYEAFWMLRQLKCDAVEDNFQPAEGPEKPTWYYHPVIKAALGVDRHIEVRDGVIVQWSDNIPTPISGYPPTPEAHPAPTNRTIKLYRV